MRQAHRERRQRKRRKVVREQRPLVRDEAGCGWSRSGEEPTVGVLKTYKRRVVGSGIALARSGAGMRERRRMGAPISGSGAWVASGIDADVGAVADDGGRVRGDVRGRWWEEREREKGEKDGGTTERQQPGMDGPHARSESESSRRRRRRRRQETPDARRQTQEVAAGSLSHCLFLPSSLRLPVRQLRPQSCVPSLGIPRTRGLVSRCPRSPPPSGPLPRLLLSKLLAASPPAPACPTHSDPMTRRTSMGVCPSPRLRPPSMSGSSTLASI